MKIAIIGAMEEEIHLLRAAITQPHVINRTGAQFISGRLHQHDVTLVKSGIGKVAAAISTTLLLSHFTPDMVINTGSAGGLSSILSIGDTVIASKVAYHDVDLTAFNYAHGQLPDCPRYFDADNTYLQLALRCAATRSLSAFDGLICSGDTFINGQSSLAQLRHHFPEAIAVEMEAAAIAHTCYRFGVPFIIVRAISDIADNASHQSFDEFLPIAAKNSAQLVMSIIEQMP